MKTTSSCSSRPRRAFTLVEMLVVIAIIATLGALLLPAIARSRIKAQVHVAQVEMVQIATAIKSYESTYGRFPVSSNAMRFASQAGEDFTYGTFGLAPAPSALVVNPASVTYNANNSEVMAILMDMERYPNGNLTVNVGHVKNPQQTKFLSAKMADDKTLPGVGPDGVYRDPWSNPYIISFDLSYDEKCRDAFYRQQVISQQTDGQPMGFDGLFNDTNPGGAGNNYQFNGGVMIWSLGPDGIAGPPLPASLVKGNIPPNKDNVCSWK